MNSKPDFSENLGQKLKDARTIKHWTLEEAEVQTKIRLRHLKAIEEGRYQDLPPDVFAVGFVRRYAQTLGLDPGAAAAIFRHERLSQRPPRPRPAFRFSPPEPITRARLIFSTWSVISLVLVLVVLLLFGYIWYQVRQFSSAPEITILNPAPNSIVAEGLVVVEGTTSPTANLFINSESVPLDEGGRFRQDVILASGINTIEITAVNRLGRETTETLNLLVQVNEANEDM